MNEQAEVHPSGLVVKRATQITFPSSLEPGVLEVVRAIYEDSFPFRQRAPFDVLLATPEWMDVALFGHKPLGFSFCSEPPEANWLFLEYLAVDREYRSQRVGSVLWEAVISRLLQSSRLTSVILEIEHPDVFGLSSTEREERHRRLRFYERHGAVTLPVSNYVVPDLEGQGTELMQLLYAGRGGVLPPDRAALRDIVKTLYTFGYELPLSNHLVVRALDSIGESPIQEDRGKGANK